jgi:hypothetical protein
MVDTFALAHASQSMPDTFTLAHSSQSMVDTFALAHASQSMPDTFALAHASQSMPDTFTLAHASRSMAGSFTPAQDSFVDRNHFEILRTLDAGGISFGSNRAARGLADQVEPYPLKRMDPERNRIGQQADQEYARYLDELNEESRRQGHTILEGDRMSGHCQVRFTLHPPSPLQGSATTNAEVHSQEDTDWADLKTSAKILDRKVHLANPAVFDPVTAAFANSSNFLGHQTAASSRPASQSPSIFGLPTGRLSEPPPGRSSFIPPDLGTRISGAIKVSGSKGLDLDTARRNFAVKLPAEGPEATRASSGSSSPKIGVSSSDASSEHSNGLARIRALVSKKYDGPTSSNGSRGQSPNKGGVIGRPPPKTSSNGSSGQSLNPCGVIGRPPPKTSSNGSRVQSPNPPAPRRSLTGL